MARIPRERVIANAPREGAFRRGMVPPDDGRSKAETGAEMAKAKEGKQQQEKRQTTKPARSKRFKAPRRKAGPRKTTPEQRERLVARTLREVGAEGLFNPDNTANGRFAGRPVNKLARSVRRMVVQFRASAAKAKAEADAITARLTAEREAAEKVAGEVTSA